MTNNFNKIKELLDFDNKNTFYFIQILKRRKENPEMENGVRVIDNFYIYSIEDLEKYENRIIEICEKNNARAYINVNKLDVERVAMFVMKKVADLIIQKQFKAVKNVYVTVCGQHSSEENKRWIVDIDTNELPYKNEIIRIINELHSKIKKEDYKILAEIPTRSGLHLISNPFNLKEFNNELSKLGIKIDVHKNTPTLLYTI
ncbi:MAG: hypothetical protein HPY57_13870 [Ignavibacteria bacterium]|nr:hypothetical protein [Ignavibacteria bacterium]